jgi:hypothetical protein
LKDEKILGERRAILLRKLYKEAVEEIVHERSEPPPVEKYCTEYDGNYNQIETTRCDTEEDFKKEVEIKTMTCGNLLHFCIYITVKSAISFCVFASRRLSNSWNR